ncbi:MAG TPA: hypothetical protein VGB06_03750, partial [Solirubrobacterales bacterium]
AAEPGAMVRVFRKASGDAGEVKSFLAAAVADGSGKWQVIYPEVPAGEFVGATQTSAAGATSELAIKPVAAIVVDGGCVLLGTCPGGGGGGGGGAGGGGGGGAATDTTAPQTVVKGSIKGSTAKFRFSSSEAGSTFECKLDRKPFRKCRSPKRYKKLKPGKHVFKVRAKDAAGNVDATPAKRRFQIVRP